MSICQQKSKTKEEVGISVIITNETPPRNISPTSKEKSEANKRVRVRVCSEKYKNYMPLGFCNDEVLHVCMNIYTYIHVYTYMYEYIHVYM